MNLNSGINRLRHSFGRPRPGPRCPTCGGRRIYIRLTADLYTDEGLLPLGAAMRSLPSIVPTTDANLENAQRAKATGTDNLHAENVVPEFVPFGGHKVALTDVSSTEAETVQRAESPEKTVLGTIGHSAKKCRRQESNLHGLSPTGT